MFYLFIAIRTIFRVSHPKAIFIQVFSFVILVLIIAASGVYHRGALQQGLRYMKTLEYEKAAARFLSAIEEDSTNARYYLHLAEAYRYCNLTKYDKKSTLFEKAKQAYSQSLALDADLLEARIGLGLLYSLNQCYEDALREFEIVIACEPGNRSICGEIGKIYLELDNENLAKKYFMLALGEEIKKDSHNKEYQLKLLDEIGSKEKKHILIESNITWCIEDSILYRGTLDSINMAESRIHDIYYAIMLKNILGNKNINFIGNNIKQKIIYECNQSILIQKYGIKILKLNILPKSIDKKLDGDIL
jgi:tetratricopeptide (TPR) repeat protein